MTEQALAADVGNAIVTTFDCGKANRADVSGWLVKSLMLASEAPGFISGEITPPNCPNDSHWKLVQRFNAASDATAWKQSDARKRFLIELQTAHADEGLQVTEEDQIHEGATVTTAIMTHVKPGMEAAYREWEGKVQSAQASFPGFRGSYFQPDTGEAGVWVSLLRFDSPEALDRWFNSQERAKLVEDVKKLVTSTDIQRVTGSFPGWVPIDAKTGKGPPNWKTFLLVLLGCYPIVMLEIRFLMPLLASTPAAVANLLSSALSVAAITWLTMPLCIKSFQQWLFPPEDVKPGHNIKWVGVVSICFLIELALLWRLLG